MNGPEWEFPFDDEMTRNRMSSIIRRLCIWLRVRDICIVIERESAWQANDFSPSTDYHLLGLNVARMDPSTESYTFSRTLQVACFLRIYVEQTENESTIRE